MLAFSIGTPTSALAANVISGTVQDTNFTALPGITVNLERVGTQTPAVATTTTDANGNYSFTPATAQNDYVVEFNPASANDTDYSNQFYNNETSYTTADPVTVTGTATTPNIDASLNEMPGNLSGTVTDASTNATLSGITVDLLTAGNNQVAQTTTAADGTYAFNTEPPGNYIVQFAPFSSQSDFMTQYYNRATSPASATPVAIHGTQTTTAINGVLTPATGHITGTVTDGTNPIQGIEVQAIDSNGNVIGNNGNGNGAAVTGADGTYTITGLPTGSYNVRFSSSSGQNFVTQYYNGKPGIASADTVSVTTQQTTPGINATMAAGGKISGTVTGESGGVVQGVQVQVLGCNTGNCSTVTAPDGTYTLPGLATGTYYLQFEAAGNYINPSYSGGATNSNSATPISVTAGSTTPFSDALPVGGKINGTLTNASTGAALQGVDVEAVDSSGSFVGNGTVTAADGTYTVQGLDTGPYKLEFFATNFVNEFYNGATSLQTATAVSVTRGAVTGGINQALLPAASGGRISGTVIGTNGLPISGASVAVYDTAGNILGNGTTTDVDGSYKTPALLPGTYKIGFSTVAGNVAFQYFNAKSTLASADGVGVSGGATTPNINATLAAGGTMTGAVTDATSHAPLGGVGVNLVDTTGKVLDSATSKADGTYTMTGIPTGSYHVKFLASGLTLPGGAPYADQYYSNKVTLASSDPVAITAGANTANINAGLVGEASVALPTTTPPTPVPVAGSPKASGAKLSGLSKRRATLKFNLAAGINGAPKLKSFKVKLPKGLSFIKKGLKKGLKVGGGGKFSDKISKGMLIVTLKGTAAKLTVSVGSKALSVSKSLAKSAKKHKIKSLTVTVTVTDAKKKNTTDKLVFKKPK